MPEKKSKYSGYTGYLLVVIAVAAAFQPIVHNGFVRYDDYTYITENPHVTEGLTFRSVNWAFTKAYACNWHPLTWLSHMLDCELFGLDPVWHHLTNVFIHTLNCLLLLGLLRKTTGAAWPGFFVAALFAVHPLHVESVAWAAERKDVLSGLFWLLTMWAYVSYTKKTCALRYSAVILCFCLGLTAKPMLVTLPFVLILWDYWPLGRLRFGNDNTNVKPPARKRENIRLIAEKIPLLILSVLSCVITYIVQEKAGVMEFAKGITLSVRLQNVLIAYAGYIGKMFYPCNLAVLYPYPAGINPLQLIVGVVVLTALSGFVIIYAGRHRFLLTGWLWFVGTLVPVIGIVQVGAQSMADRYIYLPSIGFFIMLVYGIAVLTTRLRIPPGAVKLCSGLVLGILLLCTRRQLWHWKDSSTLFEHTLAVTENNFVIHNNFGNELLNTGQVGKAIEHYRKAVQIKPDYSVGAKNLGAALVQEGRFDEGIGYLNQALKMRPDWAEVYNSLGQACGRQQKYQQAVEYLQQALQLNSDYADAHYNMGLAMTRLSQYDQAVEHFKEAMRIQPYRIHIHNDIGSIYYMQGRFDKAVEQLDSLAKAYAAEGKHQQAIQTLQKAIELAGSTGRKEQVQELEKRLKLYQAQLRRKK